MYNGRPAWMSVGVEDPVADALKIAVDRRFTRMNHKEHSLGTSNRIVLLN